MWKSSHTLQLLKESGLSLDYNAFVEQLERATYALGLLEGSQRELQNPALLVSPLTAKEATVSSRIEGTQSTVSDVFLYEAGGTPKHADVKQVTNYRTAIKTASDQIRRGQPLSQHLIRSVHAKLLDGVRHKGPLGKFRSGPVWIAEHDGDPIEKAIYIPPEAHFVADLMDNLITYISKGKELPLIRAGIAHYQFEATHPFEDGNGRIGRLLVPLILFNAGIISSPILYVSGYLDEHKDEYVAALHNVDEGGVYEPWLIFFLTAVAAQLSDTQKLIEAIYKLHNDTRSRFRGTKSPYISDFIDYLFRSPIFTLPGAKVAIKAKARPTVDWLIETFKQQGVITDTGARDGRAKIYAFVALLNLLK